MVHWRVVRSIMVSHKAVRGTVISDRKEPEVIHKQWLGVQWLVTDCGQEYNGQ